MVYLLNMVIFNSYVKLPEGINQQGFWTSMRPALQTFMTHERDEFLQKETQIFWGSSSHSHTKKKTQKMEAVPVFRHATI